MAKVVQAKEHLRALLQDIGTQSPRTAAWWRINSSSEVKEVLEDFASSDTSKGNGNVDTTKLLAEVMQMFERLNISMANQEKLNTFFRERKMVDFVDFDLVGLEGEVSVVFGGKISNPNGSPQSIPEQLVSYLVANCPRTYTVSKSNICYDLPPSVTHIRKQNLFNDEEGAEEFEFVIHTALSDIRSKYSDKTAVFYLTLGQHTGDHAFVNNLIVAKKLCSGTGVFLV